MADTTLDKSELKKQIRELKTKISEAITAKQDVKKLRRQVKHLKAATRRAAKVKAAPAVAGGESAPTGAA